jgi:hypothetical protein
MDLRPMTLWHYIFVTADGCSRTEDATREPTPEFLMPMTSRHWYIPEWKPYAPPIGPVNCGVRRFRLESRLQASSSHGVAVYHEIPR